MKRNQSVSQLAILLHWHKFYSITCFITPNYVFRSNLESLDPAHMKRCFHDPKNDPLCPIFKLGDIVKESGFSFTRIAEVVSILHGIFTQR